MQPPDKPPPRALLRNTLIALVASILLALGKLVAGLLGNSTALIADAVESLADALGSLVVWQALRVSARPPDDNHPYGYGKAEAVAALCVGILLFVAAALIVVESFQQLFTPHSPPAVWTLIVLLAVILIKEGLFRLLVRGAKCHASSAAHADAWHQRSDAMTSLAAFLGVTVAIWGPRATGIPELVYADEVAALIASGVIAITARHLARPALLELLDAAPHDLLPSVRQHAQAVPGVALVEKLTARKSGPGHLVDMHLHVDPTMTVADAHALQGRVKAAVRAAIPSVRTLLIHVEPAEPKTSAPTPPTPPAPPTAFMPGHAAAPPSH